MFGSGVGFGTDLPSSVAPKYEIFNATQGGSISGTQSGDGNRGRQEERMACLPLTVCLVEDAVEKQRATGADDLRVHGVEMGQSSMMLFVGAVEQLVKQTSSVQFVLNDSTGRIKVRHYTTSDAASTSLDGIVDGGYVTIVGSVRMSPAMHVSATFLHPVASANEVSYHMIEVAHAGLKLKQMASGAKAAMPASFTTPTKPKGPSVVDEVTPQKEVAPEVAAQVPQAAAPIFAPVVAPAKDVVSVKTLVSQFIKREGEGLDAGLHIDAVCAGVQKDASAVRAALTALVDEGEVFTTIDDDHFALL